MERRHSRACEAIEIAVGVEVWARTPSQCHQTKQSRTLLRGEKSFETVLSIVAAAKLRRFDPHHSSSVRSLRYFR
jgi:hypothetical protein